MAPVRSQKAKSHFLKHCDLPSILEPASPHETTFTATKVILTLGPSCRDVDTLCRLLEAGATCARCDLTWGSLEFHRKSLENLNEAMRRTRKLCAIMVDTVGRELIVNREATLDESGWPVHEGGITIQANSKVVFSTKPGVEASGTTLPVSYPKFTSMVQVGDTIFLGRYLVTGSEDSSVFLTVDELTADEVRCTAKNNAVMEGLLTVFHTERSTDSLSNLQNDLPILCEPDKCALKALGQEYEIDFVSLSFTRTAEDVLEARKCLDSWGMQSTKAIAKCETRQSLFNFQSIAAAADGVIMSRGNLGLDVLPEKMALIQKALINNCNIMGKPCIITRVVDTMISAPRPTRAEATDVANAVLDGVDGILLGAETLRGRHPVATVETILHICKQAEKVFDHRHHFEHLMQEAMDADDALFGRSPRESLGDHSLSTMSLASMDGLSAQAGPAHNGALPNPASSQQLYLSRLESIASSAVRAADKVGASLIIVFTQSGQTAELVSKYRPPMPILTLVVPQLRSDKLTWRLEGRSTARQCQIVRGLLPVLASPSPSGETLLEEAVLMSSRSGLVQPKDHIVVVQRVGESFVVKIVSVNDSGSGIAVIRPKSLVDLMKAAAGIADEEDLPDHLNNNLSVSNGKSSSTTLAAGAPDLVPPNLALAKEPAANGAAV
ncbi:hypothetical protein WJX72_008125 [[Myrmecia] bisecta]|uniref:Pyruvate kinase n=1 Tax=[Myrmecia] bisecta TaxID=41462 RepID=A0AAW1QRX3_9CHLO